MEVCEFKAKLAYTEYSRQPGLHKETLLQKKKKERKGKRKGCKILSKKEKKRKEKKRKEKKRKEKKRNPSYLGAQWLRALTALPEDPRGSSQLSVTPGSDTPTQTYR